MRTRSRRSARRGVTRPRCRSPPSRRCKLKGLGFSILPLPTEKKFPPPKDWEKASQNNPAVFLKNPGTHNYAVLPPPGCFGWDIDKDAPALLAELEAKLGLAAADADDADAQRGAPVLPLAARTLPDPRARCSGASSRAGRWARGRAISSGPGSVVVQDNGTLGAYYAVRRWTIADLPRAWAEAALDWRAPREVKTQPTARWLSSARTTSCPSRCRRVGGTTPSVTTALAVQQGPVGQRDVGRRSRRSWLRALASRSRSRSCESALSAPSVTSKTGWGARLCQLLSRSM